MKSIVKKATVYPLHARLVAPFRTALGQHDSLENVLLVIELTDGTRGFGEAAVASHITGETVRQTTQNLEHAALELIGRDAADYLQISGELGEKLKGNSCALAALETALVDCLTRQWKIPLWKFFGSKPHLLKTDMTIVIDDIERAEKSAREIYKRGIRAFKIKIGGNEDEDLKRVFRVQKMIGRSQIYLDANAGFTAEQTLRFLKQLAHHKIKPELIEQPVPKHDWEGLAKVTRESGITVVADESVSTLSDAVRVVREKCAGGINIKLMKFGVFQAREIVMLTQAAGLKLMIGGMMETELATTASAHVASGLGGFQYIDLDAPLFIKEKVMKQSYLSRNGIYDLRSVKSGIGVEPVIHKKKEVAV